MLEIDAQKVDDYIEAEFCDTQTIDPNKFLKYKHYMAINSIGSKIFYYRIDYKKFNYMIFRYNFNFYFLTPSNI